MSTFTVTVIPCGREDMSQSGPEELPYELTLPRHDPVSFNQDSSDPARKHLQPTGHKLSEIFMSNEGIWQSVFKQHLHSESTPNFSVYRTPFDNELEN